ncbi:homeobox-containing protein 1a isoform X3 [Engraulis encrasicolus]|uniref:homeobox-containing protein 1a isoform X3 n=1 Tax=Engraulis encrasicolus TaxID=184585 RepID=UPI002FD21F11
MSHYTDEPRYTIEQIDLLQRLRRTGMTKQEILTALDTLERLDRQHCDKFGRRIPQTPSATANNNGSLGNSVVTTGGNNNNNNSTTSSSSSAGLLSNNTSSNANTSAAALAAASSSTTSTATQTAYRTSSSSSSANATLSPPSHAHAAPNSYHHHDTSPPPQALPTLPLPLALPPPPTALAAPLQVPAPAQNGRGGGGAGGEGGLAVMPNGKLSPPRYSVSGAPPPPRPYGYEPSEDELDIEDKVEELMRRDSAIIKEEIKTFLGNRRISQAVVAQVTGISQSRISHWLLQQGSDLSEQKKRAFFRWYQLEKTTPGATLNMRPAPLALEDIVEWRQTPPPLGTAPGSFRLRRGSRFTWRKECLAVMESYFNDNQYPDEAKREEIANACNAVIQKPGKKLSDLERVTSLKVYNWFANRRKEIKRRANIAAILETHGLDVQSPGGHSNSDDIDGGDYGDQVASDQTLAGVPTLLPSWLSPWTSIGGRVGLGAQVRGGASLGRLGAGQHPQPPPSQQATQQDQEMPESQPQQQASSEGSRLTAVSWSPSPLQEDGVGHPGHQGAVVEHQDPITLAVEMAAVNHSILALAQQATAAATGDIKTEVLDDD